MASDEVCGVEYETLVKGKISLAKCLRDKGHDDRSIPLRAAWPPRDPEDEGYREHGYEDRTPY